MLLALLVVPIAGGAPSAAVPALATGHQALSKPARVTYGAAVSATHVGAHHFPARSDSGSTGERRHLLDGTRRGLPPRLADEPGSRKVFDGMGTRLQRVLFQTHQGERRQQRRRAAEECEEEPYTDLYAAIDDDLSLWEGVGINETLMQLTIDRWGMKTNGKVGARPCGLYVGGTSGCSAAR